MVDEVTADIGEAVDSGAIDTKEETEEDAENGAVKQNGYESKNKTPNSKSEENSIENTYTNLNVCFLCAKPSIETCDKCNLVGFCSEDHKKLHRPENFCFPFMVEQKEGVGRFVVAVRDIEPLELIMWDNAAAIGPKMGGPPVCLQCLKPVDGSYRCENCKWPMCNKKCADGKVHKIECEILKNAKEEVISQ